MKRLFDLIDSGCGLLVLSPIFLVLAIWVKLDSPGPVFYRQVRVGRGNKDFRLFKFRSMRIGSDKSGLITVGGRDPRVTRSGYYIRKYKLDELPQLINILKGDMAVVGPRPALWNQDDLLAERERYGANDIRPGLTGWAQIHGRDELEIPEKAMLDGYYVEHMCFALDVKCFFGTIRSVTYTEGVVEGGTGTLQREAKQEEYANE